MDAFSELWNKHAVECLFWIEIAKRKAVVAEPAAFAELLSLRNEIESYIQRLQPMGAEPLEISAGTVFDIIQFDREADAHATSEAEAHMINDARASFGQRVENVIRALTYCRGFRLSDFSVETDLMQLDSWWRYITSSHGRKELGTAGDYSSIGEPRLIPAAEELWFDSDEAPTVKLGDKVRCTRALSIPVSIPIPLTARKLWSYDTDDDEITVNGSPLGDSVVLTFEIEKPLPSIREIEQILIAAHGMAGIRRFFSYSERGVVRPDLLSGVHDAEDMETRLKRILPTLQADHQHFKGVNSFRPMLLGFSCWDQIRQGMTIESARARTAEVFDTTEDNVSYGRRKVDRAIRSYETSQLPWNH